MRAVRPPDGRLQLTGFRTVGSNAPRGRCWVLLARSGDLRQRGLTEVDSALVREADEVHEYVRQLLRESRVERFLLSKVPRGLRRQPLQELGQLPHLPDQGEHHGLGVLELL